MRKLLNTLYVTTENAYLSLDSENVKIEVDNCVIGRFPLHIIENIICFTYAGASPALIGKCLEKDINIAFFSPRGKFLYRAAGDNIGNILLRKEQYRVADEEKKSIVIARNMIAAKLYNSKEYALKQSRNHPLQVDVEKITNKASEIALLISDVKECDSLDYLRGLEGKAAQDYFSIYGDFVLSQKEDFSFQGRNRRPPLDEINAMLSFGYTLLANDCAGALSSVGLDPYCGFLHCDRAGRKSLALDLMEELRTIFVDRMIIDLINTRQIHKAEFSFQIGGACEMSENVRKILLQEWQKRKKTLIMHPYLKTKVEWGLIPYVQALLLARYLRGDLDGYPPFLWR